MVLVPSALTSILNRIDAVVQDFITDIEVQNLRRTEQSAQLHCGF
jgi:hypothetical protein